MDRVQRLDEARSTPCVSFGGYVCAGQWLEAALETLQRNGFTRQQFAEAVLVCLRHGRGKGRNLYLCGPTNCAKTFLLLPLTEIYTTFSCPGDGTYNWVSAPEKEVIFLNDLRYEANGEHRVMAWGKFLNLLEGHKVNISRPKNHFDTDIEWTQRQPIFATSDKRITRIKGGVVDDGETQPMAKRWKVLEFTKQYSDDEVKFDILPCGRCFAELILG